MSHASNKVEQIFWDALEITSDEERQAALDRVCGGDAKLRRRVEKMLNAKPKADSFLEQPLVVATSIDESVEHEQLGTQIGPYRLLEQIGEGGMGMVYRAERQTPVRREVALKIIKPGMDTRDVVARFQVERQALAMMNHPNIAKVLNAGTTESQRPYFVMELVQGVPITQFADAHKLTIRQRLELFAKVCEAVQHAHQKGIIHRDIKPSNVLVGLDRAGDPVPKIIDFGIAKAVNRELTTAALTTGVGQIMGTPLYMSPEQAGLSESDVDTRTDIYSLGVMLYELLTGTTPFDEQRLRESTYDEVRQLIREQEPIRPSSRISTLGEAAATVSTNRNTELRKLTRLLRGDLDWIVIKALEKDRDRRYATAQQLADDVRCFTESKPVRARCPTLIARSVKWVRRHRTIVMSVAVLLVFAAILVSTRIVDNTRRIEDAERAAAEHIAAASAFMQSENYADAWQSLAEARGHLDNVRVKTVSLVDTIETISIELSARVRAIDRFEHFHRLRQRAQAYMYSDQARALERVLSNCTTALDLYDVSAGEDWTRRDGFVNLSASRQAVIREAIAELLFIRARTELVKVERGSPTAAAHNRALKYLEQIESVYESMPAVFKWIEQSRRALGQPQLEKDAKGLRLTSDLALDHFIRGEFEYYQGRDDKALESYALALRRDSDHLLSQLAMGLTLLKVAQREQAEMVLQRVISLNPYITPDRVPPEMIFLGEQELRHDNRVKIIPDLAIVHFRRGMDHLDHDSEKAVFALSLALEFDPSFALAYYNRGVIHFRNGNANQAMNDWRDAVNYGLECGDVFNNRAVVLFAQGNQESALANLQHGMGMAAERAEFKFNMGVIHACRGDLDQAVADFDESIRLHPEFAIAYAHRALVYAKLGHSDKAMDDVRRITEFQLVSEQSPLRMVPVRWLGDDESERESMRRSHSEATRILDATQITDLEIENHDAKTGEHVSEMEIIDVASLKRVVCTPGVMALVVMTQAIDLSQHEYRAMTLDRLRKRPANRRRRFLETPEDRRLLSAIEISINDVTAVEGDNTGKLVDVFAADPQISGALNNPNDMVYGPDGNLYVVSCLSDEILRFDPVTGDLIDVFVTAGSAGLDVPFGLAFGPDGNLYVSSFINSEVLHFSGVSGLPIGDGVFVSSGSAGLDLPAHLTFGANGNLFVASAMTDEVLQFDGKTGLPVGDGVFVTSQSAGLDGPSDLLFDTNGNLLVCSCRSHSILRYDSKGAPVDDGVFVSAGSGGLHRPWGFTVGPDGCLYVASLGSHQILRYDPSGEFKDEFIPKDYVGHAHPTQTLFSQDDHLLVAVGADAVMKFAGSTGEYIEHFITSPRLSAPKGVTFGPDDDLYVANWTVSNVNRYRATTGEFVDEFVQRDSPDHWKAVDLRFGPDGNLYVAMVNVDSILRYDGITGEFVDAFTDDRDGPLDRPNGLTFGSDGDLYVTSSGTNNVLRYDGDTGDFLGEFVAERSGGIAEPRGLEFGPDTHLYVASPSGDVYRYNGETGDFLDVFTSGGDTINAHPNTLAFGPDGDLYINDYTEHRILQFDGATGEYVCDFVTPGLGGLYQPSGIAFDSAGALYVAHDGYDGLRWNDQVVRYASGSHAVFTVSLTRPSESVITVDYTTIEGTAKAGIDFVAVRGTLRFAPGVTSEKIIVPTIDDSELEGSEAFVVTLSNPIGATIQVGREQGQATIEDGRNLYRPPTPKATSGMTNI